MCVIGSHGGPKDKDGACLCVCRATADVFASDKSVWLRKRRSEDQTAEPRRSGAGERGRSLQSPAEKPSASCEPSSKHTTRSHATHLHHFKETRLSNSPILEKTETETAQFCCLEKDKILQKFRIAKMHWCKFKKHSQPSLLQ